MSRAKSADDTSRTDPRPKFEELTSEDLTKVPDAIGEANFMVGMGRSFVRQGNHRAFLLHAKYDHIHLNIGTFSWATHVISGMGHSSLLPTRPVTSPTRLRSSIVGLLSSNSRARRLSHPQSYEPSRVHSSECIAVVVGGGQGLSVTRDLRMEPCSLVILMRRVTNARTRKSIRLDEEDCCWFN